MATKVVTGKVRFSYAHVWEPSAVGEGEEKKYGVSLLIDKGDKKTLAKIRKAIDTAIEDGKTKLGKYRKGSLKLPLRDGDEEREDDEAYENKFFLTANSKTKPGIVDRDVEPILDQADFYSGCYGRASIVFYAFNTSGNKGIACGLNNLQKLSDGEPLAGGSTAEDDFSDDYDEDDDMF